MEYKRQVLHSSAARLRSLATQMSYRLDEGHGACHYRVGVEDDGCHSLMNYEEVSESSRVLECIARSLNAVVLERKMIQHEVIKDKEGNIVRSQGSNLIVHEPSVLGNGRDCLSQEGGHAQLSSADENKEQKEELLQQLSKQPGIFTRAELTIQRVETHLLDPSPISLAELARATAQNGGEKQTYGYAEGGATSSPFALEEDMKLLADQQRSDHVTITETLSARNIRVAVVGNVDAGKSTLIGTLTTSSLDDGRGKSRTSIMKHRHEIESGRTSTATTHLMGFRSDGAPIAGKDKIKVKRKTEDEVARESYRVITLMDLAGHEKYLKTT